MEAEGIGIFPHRDHDLMTHLPCSNESMLMHHVRLLWLFLMYSCLMTALTGLHHHCTFLSRKVHIVLSLLLLCLTLWKL